MPFVSYLISEFCHFFRLVLFLVFLFSRVRTRCQLGHRERKRLCVARVSTVGARGSTRADFEKTSTYDRLYVFIRAAVLLVLQRSKKILGYGTRNGKVKRLEPHFQISATRSTWKEFTQTAAALPPSQECTKEPISALPNYEL